MAHRNLPLHWLHSIETALATKYPNITTVIIPLGKGAMVLYHCSKKDCTIELMSGVEVATLLAVKEYTGQKIEVRVLYCESMLIRQKQASHATA